MSCLCHADLLQELYYTHFWVWDDDFSQNPQDYEYLTRDQARLIDQTVDAYNTIIKSAAANRGWHVVDLCQKLDQLAYRRQQGTPQYEFPQELIAAMQANPATRYRFNVQGRPILDTRYLGINLSKTTPEERYKGGFISLDGIHPTTIGYGLVAHEFLKVIGQVVETNPLDWTKIVEADTLVKDPPQNLESLQGLLGFIASQEPLTRLIKVIGKGF